jgi:predicted AAA+ superfamily ATPase
MNQERIRQALIDQQSEALAALENIHLIERAQLEVIAPQMDRPLAKVIIGLRRTGKSTLSLQLSKTFQSFYVNFDDEFLGQLRSQDLDLVLQIGLVLKPKTQVWIFDEIQNVDGWELFINRLLRKKMNIIITGSNSRLLSGELATHLTGRQLSFEVLPFSFSEFLQTEKFIPPALEWTTRDRASLSATFTSYLEKGGLPEVQGSEPQSSFTKMYIKELYDKILNRDIVQRRNIKNIKVLREIALFLMSLNGRDFSYQSIRKTVGINSLSTTKNYVEFIQESFLGFIVEPYSNKVKERISKPKKFYVIDPRISEVIGATNTKDSGRKLEGLVYLELRRRNLEIYSLKEVKYEIDFAVRVGRSLVQLIQVCWDLTDLQTRTRELSALKLAANEFKVKDLLLVTATERGTIVEDGFKIQILPFYEWALNPEAKLQGIAN